MDITHAVELSLQDIQILKFLRSMWAFAYGNIKSGEGISLQDINSVFGNSEEVLESLCKKDCISQDTLPGYNERGEPTRFRTYYIKPIGAFSLYKYENSKLDDLET